MRPLTDSTPKPLLKVGAKPLIVWHIERLSKAGFKQIVINHAHLGQQIEDTLGDGAHWGVQLQYSPEIVALETAGGIAYALPLLGDAPFLVINGDIFSDIDYRDLVNALPLHGLAHLVMVDNPSQHLQGDFVLTAGMVKADGPHKLTFSGVGVYHPDLFVEIERGEAAKLAPLLRSAMAAQRVSGEYHRGKWYDIGTPERLAELDAQFTVSY